MVDVEAIKKKRTQLLLELMKRKGNARVLDVGCQSGELCRQLLQLRHEPYGIEIVEELIDTAKARYPQIKFELADCEKHMLFADKFFDVVWAGDVIEHIRFTDVFVNEINRVLKRGGIFFLSTPMHNMIKNVLISLYNFEKHFDPEFPHLRFYSVRSLTSTLEKRGFEIVSVNYIGRIRPIASSMFVLSRKVEDKEVASTHRY